MKPEPLARLTLNDQAAIAEYMARIHASFPARLTAVTLFGSKARGDDDAESDIDLLVLVDAEDQDLRDELWRVASDVSLQYNVVISARVFAQSRWARAKYTLLPLYRAITTEGVPLMLESVPV